MTFDEYLQAVGKAAFDNPRWRVGQAAFNVLCEHRPDLSEQVRATAIDPFYDSNMPTKFYEWVKEHWS